MYKYIVVFIMVLFLGIGIANGDSDIYKLYKYIDSIVDNNCCGNKDCKEEINKLNAVFDNYYVNNISNNYNTVFEVDRLIFLVSKYVETKNKVFLHLRVNPQMKKVSELIKE